jgi:hypothetical protein
MRHGTQRVRRAQRTKSEAPLTAPHGDPRTNMVTQQVARERDVRTKHYATPEAVVAWVVKFANCELTTLSAHKRQRLETDILVFSRWISRAPPMGFALDELQGEIRRILGDLSAGDSWADTPSYAQLALRTEWKRQGLEQLGTAPTWASTASPIEVDFQWWREGNAIGEQIVPHDLRSGLLMRLREAILHGRTHSKVRRCPVCGRFFLRVKRQLYCRKSCGTVADGALRKPGRRTKTSRAR